MQEGCSWACSNDPGPPTASSHRPGNSQLPGLRARVRPVTILGPGPGSSHWLTASGLSGPQRSDARQSHQGLTLGSEAERDWDSSSTAATEKGEREVLGGQRESLRPSQLPPELWTNPSGSAVQSSPSGFGRVAADNKARGDSSLDKFLPASGLVFSAYPGPES